MSTTDCRTLHVYRLPVYQKRTIAWENYTPILQSRSSSPNRAKLASERRHSTPQTAFRMNYIDFQSPSTNIFNKHLKSTNSNKDSNVTSDGVKPPSRPVSLVKLRPPPDERLNRLVSTPTSINSFTDVILPIAKKNRNTFIETPNTILTDIQSNNRTIPPLKRGKTITDDFEDNIIIADRNLLNQSPKANTAKSKSRKCRWHNSNCNFCHWYCSCPFYCWILCSLFVLILFIGLFFSKKFFTI